MKLTDCLIDIMEENPSCDAIGFSASQIPCLSRSLKVHYHVHKINLVVKFVNIKYTYFAI
jgi:hypothetical protein